MTQSNKDRRGSGGKPGLGAGHPSKAAAKQQGQLPGWTNGLRQLYDQVVDEDLPDTFRDLLARLDDPR